MHRTLLIAVVALAVGGGAAAYAVGRGQRSEPPAPDTRAKVIEVGSIEVARWDLDAVKAPRLAPPDPTPVPQTAETDDTTASADPDTGSSQPETVVTSVPAAPTEAPADPEPPAPTQAPADPEPTITGGTGGDP